MTPATRLRWRPLTVALLVVTGLAAAAALHHMDNLPAFIVIAPGYLVQAWLFETHRALGGFGYQVTMIGVSALAWTLIILSATVGCRVAWRLAARAPKTLSLCLAATLALPPVPGRAQTSPPSSDSGLIAALERSIEQATMRGDVAYLDSVYAPSFRFTHSTGTIEERAPRLAALGKRTVTIVARDLDSLDVEVHGDIALTTGRIHVRQDSPDPKWREYTIRYVRVYVRRGGRWQLLTHHSTGESFGPRPP